MSQPAIKWDGRTYPYIPSKELKIHPSLKRHTRAAEKVDPVTYEVVRHAMWNINVEHGNTIMKISGSPSCAYGHDFNPCLLDENGDFVFFGPFLQYLSSATGSAVKWTMEYRAENPGIHEGDIFLTNDPWIGATHQSDVALVAPVFWEGELFCWVGNTLHQWDMGGTAPGGFNPMAADVFWESGCIPPIKIVEGGQLRKDLEEEYARRSRMPQLVVLDLHAEIAGCTVARERLLALITRYGAETVKGVMRKLQDDSEKAFLRRLETIPDGTWRESSWIELKGPGDRHLYRNSLVLTKRGDKLIFSNEGSDPQAGTLNCTMVAWKGAIASMICSQMLFDQMFVVEGAYRHMEFEVVPGTISCATFPAAVSAAPPGVLLQTLALSGLVISKMLACSADEQLRSEVQSCMGAAMYPVCAFSGLDQRGAPYASFLLDPVGAALAGLSWKDGVDTGGWPWDLQSTMPNVEDNEWFYPILYLWRKELVNSGGAGKYRGGNAGELAFIPHGTDHISLFTASGHCAVPGPGLHGGLSPATTRFTIQHGANAAEQVRETRRMPVSAAELHGKTEYVAPKAFDVSQAPTDVFLLSWAGAGGYGDPLERDPAHVVLDLQRGSVTPEWAYEAYGVVLDRQMQVDMQATERRRAKLRKARLGKAARPARQKIDPTQARRIAEGLLLTDGRIACSKCNREICQVSENYKLHCAVTERPVTAANAHILPPKIYVDDKMVFRSYACPSCGLLIQMEIARPTDPPLWDMQLANP
ncbi:MAG: hydantoinase B/oxoprolinase family protein [Deltaproteobacteria bacterium]|nr:hydantoinase B/oxoprolinase family protein [Deltaproteobacteria bacterium]